MEPLDEASRQFRCEVLLSVQRALVGEITAQMRAISVEVSSAGIRLWVYHHGPMTDAEKDDFDAGAVTQISADFVDAAIAGLMIDCQFIRRDTAEGLWMDVQGKWVFGRSQTVAV